MSRFSIPYTKGIKEFLSTINSDKISDVYFSDGTFPSARVVKFTPEERQELRAIKNDLGLKLNFVFNPQHYDITSYLDIKGIIKKLVFAFEYYQFDVITMNNTYLLAIEDVRRCLHDHDVRVRLSVNNRVSSLEQVKLFHLEFAIDSICLDRNLNRNKDELDRIIDYASKHNIELYLLVNEGCLPNCPFKPFCDDIISQRHKLNEEEQDVINNMIKSVGCVYDFTNHPWKALQSPFISPTWINNYDTRLKFKIAGRNKHIAVLKDIILAYMHRIGDIDFSTMFSTYRINEPFNFYDLDELQFFNKVKNCKLNCHSCNFCKQIYNKLKGGK